MMILLWCLVRTFTQCHDCCSGFWDGVSFVVSGKASASLSVSLGVTSRTLSRGYERVRTKVCHFYVYCSSLQQLKADTGDQAGSICDRRIGNLMIFTFAPRFSSVGVVSLEVREHVAGRTKFHRSHVHLSLTTFRGHGS